MEYLNKLNRSDLEDIFGELMTDLKEVNPELAEKGITEETDIIEYYLSMNMFYNDYKHIFDKYNNLNQKDIYYDFSEAFINDKDAPKYKVEKYFLLVK